MSSLFLKYKILPPLFGFISGILITEWMGNEWLLIVFLSPICGFISLIRPRLRFLIFIPIGILFSTRPEITENHILRFMGKEVDIEGVLFKSPESRENGSRLFIDVRTVFIGGKENRTSGKIIITTEQRIKGLAYGERIRAIKTRLKPFKNFQNPGSFDVKRYNERQGIYGTGFIPSAEWIISFGRDKSASFFINSLDKQRVKFGDFVRRNTPFPEGEILSAITIGDKGAIPSNLRNQFSEAGIAHLLAISGLHMGVVAVFFYFTIKWILKRSEYLLLRFRVPRLTAALTIIPILAYTAITGFATPVVRASIMAFVYLVSIAIGRDENKLNTLAVSAFIILLWHPWALFELSFQLSFASVLGILLMHRSYPFRLATIKDKFLTSIKTTCAASFATLPFIINSFGVFSVISVPANLIFVPLVEFLIVPIGLISFLVFLLSETIATPLLHVNVYLIKSLLWGSNALLQIPFSSLTVASLGALSLVFYGLMLTSFLFLRTNGRYKIILPVLIIGFLGASAYRVLERPDRGLLEVNFLDAGDRNITFVQLPRKRNILIDGGFSYYDRGGFIERAVVTPFLLKSGVTKIDYLILTSLDKDHLNGIKELVRKFRVERLWTNGAKLDSGLWEQIYNKGISWKNISDEVEPLLIDGVRLEFLKPRGEFEVEDSSRPYPILGRLTFKQANFLFGEGVGEKAVQKELIEIYADKIRSSVLYVPRVSGFDNRDFISAVSPKILVTRVAYRKQGDLFTKTAFFHSDTQGTVTVLTDGKMLRVKTYDGEKQQFVH